MTDVWGSHATQWHRVAGPLRPGPSDLAAMRAALANAQGTILLLGATAELLALGADVLAVDSSPDMVARWHAMIGTEGAAAIQLGDWRNLASTYGTHRFAAAVGDGSLNMLTWPQDVQRVLGELSVVLAPGAPLVVRLFAAPEPELAETVEELAGAAARGTIGTFHAFKWRLAHALTAARGDANIPVAEIRDSFVRLAPDRASFARRAGWPEQDIDTIDAYRGSRTVYCFPTLATFRAGLPPGWRIEAISTGQYELAERCPVVVLRYG